MRSLGAMCNDKWGLFRAHLNSVNSHSHEVIAGKEEVTWTYSNFSAPTILGNPDTIPTISHGRKLFLDVRAAPPFALPLC